MVKKEESILIAVTIVLVALFILSGWSMMGFGSYGMWGMMSGLSSGFGFMWLFGWLIMILFTIALVLLILWLIKQLQPHKKW